MLKGEKSLTTALLLSTTAAIAIASLPMAFAAPAHKTCQELLAARPMPNLEKLVERSRYTKSHNNPDSGEAFWDILKLRDAGKPNAVPVLAEILVNDAGNGRIHGYAAAQALFCIGGKEALDTLDKHLSRLDEYNEELASLYVFHWEMPEPKRSEFIERYLLKDIGHDLELTLEAKPDHQGRNIEFRLTVKNVSARPLAMLMPRFHKLYLRSADGRFLSWHRSRCDKPNTKWIHLKSKGSEVVEATGEVVSANDFTSYELQEAHGAPAMLSLEGDRCFIDKPGQFQAIFVLEQKPMSAAVKNLLKIDNPWIGRVVSTAATITLGQPAPSPNTTKKAANTTIDRAEVRHKIASLAVPDETQPDPDQAPNWLRARTKWIVPELIAGLNDKDPKVAEECLRLLANAPPSNELTNALIEKAGDEKSPLRYDVLRQLERSAADPRAARLLDAASMQPEKFSKPLDRARWASLAGHKDRAVDILKPLLPKRNPDSYDRVEAIRLLGEIGEPDSISLLEPIAQGDNWGMAVEAHVALAKIDPDKHGLTKDQQYFLMNYRSFKESEGQIHRRLAELAKLNTKEVRPFVMHMLRDDVSMWQNTALSILAVWRDKEALPEIRQLMRKKPYYCQRDAVAAFLSVEDNPANEEEVLDVLVEADSFATNNILRGIVLANIPVDRKVAMLKAATAKIGSPRVVPDALSFDLPELPTLLASLMDNETNLQTLAAYCNLTVRDKERRFAPQVRRALSLLTHEPTIQTGDKTVSQDALEATPSILGAAAAYDLKDIAPIVQGLAKSKNPTISDTAWVALAKLGLPGTAKHFLAELNAEDPDVRKRAFAALIHVKPTDEAERAECENAVLANFVAHPDDFDAMHALVKFGGEKSAKVLKPLLDDPNLQRSLQAAWVLAQLPVKPAAAKAIRRVAIFGLFHHQVHQLVGITGFQFQIAPNLNFQQFKWQADRLRVAGAKEIKIAPNEGPVLIPDDLLQPFPWDADEQQYAVRCYRFVEAGANTSGMEAAWLSPVLSDWSTLPKSKLQLDATQLPLLTEIAAHDSHIKRLMVRGLPVPHFEYRQLAAKIAADITKKPATYVGLAGETIDSAAFPEPYKDQDQLVAKFFIEQILKAGVSNKPQDDRDWRLCEFYRTKASRLVHELGPQLLDAIRREAKQQGIDILHILPTDTQ